MYSTLGSSLLPVICVDSRSRRSLALPLGFAWAPAAAGLLAAGLAGVDAGFAAGVAAAGGGALPGAEVFTPGSIESLGLAGGGVWATAATANNSIAPISSLVMSASLRRGRGR